MSETYEATKTNASAIKAIIKGFKSLRVYSRSIGDQNTYYRGGNYERQDQIY